jgi:GntR family transcriptional regulator / MocR family aminotransferase
MVSLDPRRGAPLQAQIYEAVRRAIVDGVLAPGTRLPSTRALADDLGVSRTTAVLALGNLLAEGYLVARRGSGTFVAGELPDDRPRAGPAGRAHRHPPLSRRGQSLADNPPNAVRIPGPSRPFRVGVPALGAFPAETWAALAARRLRTIGESLLDYGPIAGLQALREAIAAHVQAARGTRLHADQVFVCAGAKPGLDFVARVLLDPGDVAWLEEPGYTGARAALLAAGARIVPVPVDDQGLDVDAGRRRAPDARLAIVTPSHQFPLGVPMSLARRRALITWASAAGAWIVEDDYDSEFRYGARPTPCLHGLDPDGRVIYVGSFSKTLYPALRLGFVVVPPDLATRIAAARRAIDHHPPLLEQAVLADFIAGGYYERHLRRMQRIYRERLDALTDGVRRHLAGALRLRPTRSGLHAVAELTGADAARVFRAAAARGVEVMPISAYALEPARALNGLVLGFAGARQEAILAATEKLASAIEAA